MSDDDDKPTPPNEDDGRFTYPLGFRPDGTCLIFPPGAPLPKAGPEIYHEDGTVTRPDDEPGAGGEGHLDLPPEFADLLEAAGAEEDEDPTDLDEDE